MRLTEVALDLVAGSCGGLVGILAGLPQRPALPQQVPALVELDLQRPKALVFAGLVDVAVLKPVAQFVLLGDELTNVLENVAVLVHRASLPDYGGPVAGDSKPEIDFPDGPAPAELVIEDLEVGDGAEAVPGGTVTVHYLGVEYDTGEEFDSSWNRGESIEFPLRGLIQGWQDGIPGMKVGGRRKLTIPPAQAYGPAGSGHRLSGKTLIFVIDLLGVR